MLLQTTHTYFPIINTQHTASAFTGVTKDLASRSPPRAKLTLTMANLSFLQRDWLVKLDEIVASTWDDQKNRASHETTVAKQTQFQASE